jgi:hypothetical protein
MVGVPGRFSKLALDTGKLTTTPENYREIAYRAVLKPHHI